jgi:predicted site-specific integrase-resolvase
MARAKLDAAVTQKICDLLRAGNFLEVAARAAGVHPTTVHRWLRTGRDQKKGRYRRFFDTVEKAQAEAEARDVALIAKAASEDWRAAAWRLERKAPRRYGARVQISVQEEVDSILDKLERDLKPEEFARALESISSREQTQLPAAVDHEAAADG